VEKLLLIGYRAYGDWIYSVPVLPYLFERYDVYVDLNMKGFELFHNDPRFKRITLFELEKYPLDQVIDLARERWDELGRTLKPDRTINLWRTLETECIAERYQDIFHGSLGERRSFLAGKNFYDAVFRRCNIPVPEKIKLDCFYFDEHETAWGQRWRKRHEDEFVLIMPMTGSCWHKMFTRFPELVSEILDRYEDAVIYVTGDDTNKGSMWSHPRIKNAMGYAPVKQIMLMAKHADMVIGPETGVVAAAGMWGTPKIMLCTASGVYQTCKYHDNDFSIQSDVYCSPCHLSVYGPSDCLTVLKDGDISYPACIEAFSIEEIMGKVDYVYRNLRRNIYQAVH